MSDFETLERKFCKFEGGLQICDGTEIAGYASYFGKPDKGGDVVVAGAYSSSLNALSTSGGTVKMLWQHDPAQPIGVWDEVREDARGLYVKGRLLTGIEKGREAAALVEAGVIDGLSIGYRTVRSTKNDKGQRLLSEIELWEVSLVTFPMLPEARVGAKAEEPGTGLWQEVAELFEHASKTLAQN